MKSVRNVISVCLFLTLFAGLFTSITPQADAPPSGIKGIEIVDSIIRVDQITPPETKIFNIEARDNILYLLGGERGIIHTKLYISSDLGSSWTYKYTFTGFAPPTWGHGFYVTKTGIILLYVKNLTDTTYKMFRSGDGGNTFTEVGQDMVADKRFWKATEDLSGNIYIGLYPTYPLVYKSSDNGQTWNLFWNGTSYGETHIHEIKSDPYTGAIWIGTGDRHPLIVNTYNGGVSFNISRTPTVTAFGFTSRYVVTGKDGSRNLIYDKYSDKWSEWFTREYDYLSHIWHMASYQDKVYSVSDTSPDGGLPATYVWYKRNSVRLFRSTEKSALWGGFIKITFEPIYSKWFVLWVDKNSNMKVLRFGDLNTEEILYLNYKQNPIFYSEFSSYDTLTRRIVLLADEEITVSFADSYITNAEIRLLPYRIVENSSMIRYTWDFEDGKIPKRFTIGSGVTAGVVSNNPYSGTKSLGLNYSGTTLKWSNTGARVINWTNGGVPIGYVTFLVLHHTQDIKTHAPDFSSEARVNAAFWNTNDTITAFLHRGFTTALNKTNNWNTFAFFNSTNNNRLWKAQIAWKHNTTANTWSDSIQFYVVNSSMFWKIAHNPPFIHNINETPNKVYINDTLYTVDGWTSLSALGEVKTLKLKLKSGGMGAAIAEIRGTMKFKSNIPFTKGTNVYYAKRGSSLASITNYDKGILTIHSVTNESSITSATYMNNRLTLTIDSPSGTTSTTKVYCGIRGEPTAIYTVNGTLTWNYNASTTILTLNATYTSPTKMLVYWKLPGDVDGDGYVGSADFSVLAGAYGSSEGDPAYDQEADFDLDGYVGSADFGILAGNYGRAPGDTDSDGDVGIYDICILAVAYESHVGEPNYNPNSDIDGNNHVNSNDLRILAEDYGESQP